MLCWLSKVQALWVSSNNFNPQALHNLFYEKLDKAATQIIAAYRFLLWYRVFTHHVPIGRNLVSIIISIRYTSKMIQ